MDTILAAKRELVEALPAGGVAILNRDDERVMSMAAHTVADVFTYGLDDRADLWADNIHSMGLSGIRFTLHFEQGPSAAFREHGEEALSLRVPLLGRHSVHTALRASAVGLAAGLSWEEIVRGLSESSVAQLRLVASPGPGGSTIIDDTYNSSPDSALAALNLLADLSGRRVAVLGDMLELGEMEEASHRLVGRRAADVAAILVTVGPRARTIASEAERVGMPAANIYRVEDAAAAVPLLTELIAPGDVILIKGSLGVGLDHVVAELGRLAD
jgi:UDP-N-acetylmuramoyl-tripeptide--D-alanyl-D-alanine ligase